MRTSDVVALHGSHGTRARHGTYCTNIPPEFFRSSLTRSNSSDEFDHGNIRHWACLYCPDPSLPTYCIDVDVPSRTAQQTNPVYKNVNQTVFDVHTDFQRVQFNSRRLRVKS